MRNSKNNLDIIGLYFFYNRNMDKIINEIFNLKKKLKLKFQNSNLKYIFLNFNYFKKKYF